MMSISLIFFVSQTAALTGCWKRASAGGNPPEGPCGAPGKGVNLWVNLSTCKAQAGSALYGEP